MHLLICGFFFLKYIWDDRFETLTFLLRSYVLMSSTREA